MAGIRPGIPLGDFPPPSKLPPGAWQVGYERLRDAINAMLQGRSNATGEVTIAAGDSPLVVLDVRVAETSTILIMIGSEDLANNFIWWISAVDNGSFTFSFTHSGQLAPTLIRYSIQG